MIGIFRRLIPVPAPTNPSQYRPEPVINPDREAAFTKALADLAARNVQTSRLSLELDSARAAARREKLRADVAEQALRELRIATATPAATELARARRTLTDYEDLLAGCRRDHGSNIRASASRTGTADTDAPYDEIAAIKRREDV